MDYERLSQQIFKPTWNWTLTDYAKSNSEILQQLCYQDEKAIYGSQIQLLDTNYLQNQMDVKSKISRRKILKWIQIGFNEFNQYLMLKDKNEKMDIQQQLPIFNRASTQILRQRIKPQNTYENNNNESTHNEIIVTTYEGPHVNFYRIGSLGTTIGKQNKNSIIVLQDSVERFHAQIKHQNGKFSLRDLGTKSGTFIKVFQKQILIKGMIIQMGSFQFNVININQQKSQVILSYINMINNFKEQLTINLSNKKSYNFGRKNTNDFHYNDHHLSGIYSQIYQLNGQFIIQDISSTNGTWIRISPSNVASQYYQIYHGCVFKIGTTSTYICKFNTDQNYLPKKIIKCEICKLLQNNCVLIPCKHNIICHNCAVLLHICPICQIPIQDKFTIFK